MGGQALPYDATTRSIASLSTVFPCVQQKIWDMLRSWREGVRGRGNNTDRNQGRGLSAEEKLRVAVDVFEFLGKSVIIGIKGDVIAKEVIYEVRDNLYED